MQKTNKRKETTAFLAHLLENRMRVPGTYYAKEVVIDYGTDKCRRVDYMHFEPVNTMTVSGIEKGDFICYEIKSCLEDIFSGNGLNFIGDRNYIVTTADVARKFQDDRYLDTELRKQIQSTNPEASCYLGINVGMLVAVPNDRNMSEELKNPTEIPEDKKLWDNWKLIMHKGCRKCIGKKRSCTEMMFLMLKAAVHGR